MSRRVLRRNLLLAVVWLGSVVGSCLLLRPPWEYRDTNDRFTGFRAWIWKKPGPLHLGGGSSSYSILPEIDTQRMLIELGSAALMTAAILFTVSVVFPNPDTGEDRNRV